MIAMNISFEAIGNVNFDIKKIFAMNQHWSDNYVFSMTHPRPTDGLLLFSGCEAELRYSDGTTAFYAEKDSLVLIPHGKTYSWTFHECGKNDGAWCKLLEFLPICENGETLEFTDGLKIIDSSRSGLYKELFSTVIKEFSRPQVSFPRLKSATLSLIATASEALRKSTFSNKSFNCIYKGIKYLEKNPLQEKSIAEIAKDCGVSVNYFERLFREYSGKTPAVYRMQKKIDRAKAMLEIPSLSVEQIADELNYNDCAYFCKCFKKLCGMTANEYRASVKK